MGGGRINYMGLQEVLSEIKKKLEHYESDGLREKDEMTFEDIEKTEKKVLT